MVSQVGNEYFDIVHGEFCLICFLIIYIYIYIYMYIFGFVLVAHRFDSVVFYCGNNNKVKMQSECF